MPRNTFDEQPWFREVPKLRAAHFTEFADLEPDVVILTATMTERDTVLGYMHPLNDQNLIVKLTSGPDTLYLGILGTHTIVLVMSGMGAIGRDASILTTSDAIRTWNPKAVIAVGFAFGMNPKKQHIGDVLISKTVSSYEPQRVQDELTISRGMTAESGQHLLNRFLNVHGWRFQRPDGSLIELRAGQILSGEKLIDSKAFKRRLLERYPEAIGGEMEGAGLYAAAERAKVEWIIIKGICDWADGNKKKQYQRLAAAAAASLVEHVLSDTGTLSELSRPRSPVERHTKFSRDESAASRVPALLQLPQPVGDFVGREKEITMLLKVLRSGGAIAGINGLAGMGKTELAVVVANRLCDSYPDAQLFLRMWGIDELPREPQEVLATCIRAFLGPNVEIPSDLELLINQYRTCLARRRALIVLDNAVDAAQVRPLLPPSGSALIITSRNSLAISPMLRLFLDQLRPKEAKRLFRTIAPRVAPIIVEEICALCGYLPLALRAAATLLAVRIDLDPLDYLEKLRDEHTRLEHLSSADAIEVGVNASFNLSYNHLSTESARVLRQLTAFAETFDADAEEFVCNDANHHSLSELLIRSLLSFNDVTRRYRLHDLFRLYTKQQIGPSENRNFESRHAAYYLARIEHANNLSLQGGELLRRGLDLFDTERTNIEVGFKWSKENAIKNTQAAQCCTQYPNAGRYILDLRQSLNHRISWLESAMSIARNLEDKDLMVCTLNSLGWAFARAKNLDNAIPAVEEALALARELHNQHEEAYALDTRGWCHAEIGELQRAIEYHEEALAIGREVSDLRLQCRALNNLGWAYVGLEDAPRGIAFHRQALAIAQQIGDSYEEGVVTRYLARATAQLKEVQQAIELYEAGLMIFRGIGSSRDEWSVLDSLGDIYKDQGESRRAIEYFHLALTAAKQDEDCGAQSTALNSLGTAYSDLGEYQRAIEFYEQDLFVCRGMGNRHRESKALENLGDTYREIEDFPKALEIYLERLELNRQINNRAEECRALNDVGNTYLDLEHPDRALNSYKQALEISQEIGSNIDEAWALHNLGQSYFRLGEPEPALDLYKRSLLIFQNINNLKGQAWVLSNLGQLCLTHQQFEWAIKYYENLLLIAREPNKNLETEYEVKSLVGLGCSYYQFGEGAKGLPFLQEALLMVRQSGAREAECFVLNMIGYCHTSSNEQLAIENFEKALSIARELGEKVEQCKALDMLGMMSRKEDPKRAIEYFEELLLILPDMKVLQPTLHEVQIRSGEAALLRLLGLLYVKLDNFKLGSDYADRAIVIFRELGNHERERELLRFSGECYSKLGKHERAIDYFEKALSIIREMGDSSLEGDTLVRLLTAYWQLGDIRRIKDFCEKALPAYAALNIERKYQLATLVILVDAYNKSGEPLRAADCFEQAITLCRELDELEDPKLSEPSLLNEIGCSYVSIGKVHRAAELFNQALGIACERKDNYNQGWALNNLGWAHSYLDERRRTISLYTQGLSIFRESNDREGQCHVLLNLGSAYKSINEISQSFKAYEDVLSIAHELKDRRWERKALDGIGDTYRKQGKLHHAIEVHERALALARDIGDRLGEGLSLLSMGLDCNEQLEYGRSIELQEQALLIFNEVRSRFDEIEAIEKLGETYRKHGEVSRAIRLHNEGLIIAREMSARFRECWLLGSLAEDYLECGQMNRATVACEEQLALSRELNDPCRQANALFRLARIADRLGDYAQALLQAEAALKILKRIESTDADEVAKKIGEFKAASSNDSK